MRTNGRTWRSKQALSVIMTKRLNTQLLSFKLLTNHLRKINNRKKTTLHLTRRIYAMFCFTFLLVLIWPNDVSVGPTQVQLHSKYIIVFGAEIHIKSTSAVITIRGILILKFSAC